MGLDAGHERTEEIVIPPKKKEQIDHGIVEFLAIN